MHIASYFVAGLIATGLTAATPSPSLVGRSPEPAYANGKYIVDRRTQFSKRAVWTFTGTKLPAGLTASNYGDDTRVFKPSNVNVRNGYLELLVNGGQKMPYKSGEISTNVQNIKYASVRTTAILTEVHGVCNGAPLILPNLCLELSADWHFLGMFFYKNDTQESDIEWLSDPNSESNAGTRMLWFTNQDANGDGESTYKAVSPPSKPTTTEHEYRIDWTAGLVQFYVDGVKRWQTKQDVPNVSGPWVWNNWSNGDKGWSVGPPAKDAVFKIKKIDMYYNTA